MLMTIRGEPILAAMVARVRIVGLLALLFVPFCVDAQQKAKVYRLGFLASGTSTASVGMVEAFRDGMSELGWVEGRNVVIDYRFAEGRNERLPDLAAELVQKKVDLIVAANSPTAVAARNATRTIPIVMTSVSDPVGFGLVDSLARPGGNVTGVTYSAGLDIFGKQLQLLTEVVPTAKRVAVLWNPSNPGHAAVVSNVKAAAQTLGLSAQFLEARTTDEFDGAFAAMAMQRAQALLVASDSMFGSHAAQLGELTTKNRLPSVHGARSNVEAGGLILYGANILRQVRRSAVYVDKILKGAKPADLPVEQPTMFELVINLKTARALNLTIPQSLLLRADFVIE
jgi:putative tryptophan/tyrosine transport system substrate-binding protein